MFVACTTACTYAQQEQPKINLKETTRIISTLAADDMMGRNSLKPEMAKPANFIAAEFKKAGLKFLPNETGYLQKFMMKSIRLKTVSVKAETVLASADYLLITDVLSGNTKTDGFKKLRITADENFIQKFREALKEPENAMITIDKKHSAIFKRIQSRYSEERTIFPSALKKNQLLFVLADEEKDYELSFENVVKDVELFNVAGVLPGKSKEKELVVFSGHYDHLGVIDALEGDSIANGADDDASGVTAVIQLANYFSKQKNNERTLIFVAFTAEEIGGFGSQYFSKQLNPNDVVAMFNIEMIGKPSKFGVNNAFITGYERSDFGKILQKNLSGSNFKFYPDPYPEQNLFFRSDNATLARLGVPAHTISSDQIDSDKLYHTVNDEVESLNMQNINEIIKAIAMSAKSIVAGKDAPTRVTGVE